MAIFLPLKNELWLSCRNYGLLSDSETRRTFRLICQSVKKLHDIGLIHRDIKPENMFYSSNKKSVKIIDLGSAEDLENLHLRKMNIDDNPKRKQHLNFVGTSAFMAPECVRNQGSYLASDIWSLGCLLYQLYVGFLPFRGGSDYLIFERSTELNFNLPMSSLSEHVLPTEAKDLILSMLKISHAERPTISQVLEHPLFRVELAQTAEDKLLKQLSEDLINRVGVHRLEGLDNTMQTIDKAISDSGLEVNRERLEHFKVITRLFIFDIEPENQTPMKELPPQYKQQAEIKSDSESSGEETEAKSEGSQVPQQEQ